MKKLDLLIQIKLINFPKKRQYIFLARDHKISQLIINLVLKIFQNQFIKIKLEKNKNNNNGFFKEKLY